MDSRERNTTPEPPWRPLLSLPDDFRRLNLDVLRSVAPRLSQLLHSYEKELERVEVQVFGLERIRARIDGGEPQNLIPPTPEQQAFRARIDGVLALQPELVVLAGVHYGAEVDGVFALAPSFPQTSFLVLERDPLAILLAFSTHNRSVLLESGVFVWAVGEPLLDSLAETIHRHALYAIADAKIQATFGMDIRDDASRQPYMDAIRELIPRMMPWREELMRTAEHVSTGLHENPSGIGSVWSAGKKNDYTATPILKALHRGLSSHGVESRFTELTGTRADRLVHRRGLLHADPDILLLTNHPTCLSVPDGAFHRVVWVTDDPALRIHRHLAPKYGADELVLYADRAFEPTLAEQGADRRGLLPAFAVLETEGAIREELAYPIVYVGMINNLEPALGELDRDARELLEGMASEMARPGNGTVGIKHLWTQQDVPDSLVEWTEELCRRHRKGFEDLPTRLTYVTYVVGTFRRRWQIAKALLPHGLHVYGGRDWLRLLGDKYADRYHGILSYDELPDVYHSARIVLNIHSAQCPTCLNIRDYDVLMAGGCMLADPVAEMAEETLMPGRDLATATEPEVFADVVRDLLADDSRRQALAEAGRATVLERHLPEHRAEIILRALHR